MRRERRKDTNGVLGREGEGQIRDEGEEGGGRRVPLVDRGMEHKPRPVYVRMWPFCSLSVSSFFPHKIERKEWKRREGNREEGMEEEGGREGGRKDSRSRPVKKAMGGKRG